MKTFTNNCSICGPEFVSKCPHSLPLNEMLDEVLGWRSDDFDHDCRSLLEAESRALQDIGEKFIAALADLERLKGELSDFAIKYRLIDLANKEWSRNDAITFGRLFEENARLKGEIVAAEVRYKNLDRSFALLSAENAQLRAENERLKPYEEDCVTQLEYDALALENEAFRERVKELTHRTFTVLKKTDRYSLETDIGEVDPFVTCAAKWEDADGMVGKTYRSEGHSHGAWLPIEGTLIELTQPKGD